MKIAELSDFYSMYDNVIRTFEGLLMNGILMIFHYLMPLWTI